MRPIARGIALFAASLFAAWICSPEWIAAHLSPDGELGDFVIMRIQVLRWALPFCAGLIWCWGTGFFVRCLNHRAVPWIVAASVLALLLTEGIMYESEPCSGGILTYGALRTARGEVPCRDFFTYVFPGGYYYLAGIYRLLGASLDVARLFANTLPKFLMFPILYQLSRHFVSRPAAAGVGAYAVLILSPNPDNAQIYNGNLAICLGFLGLLAALRFYRFRDARCLALAGALTGASALVRQDLGAYALLAHAAWLGALSWRKELRLRDAAYYALGWGFVAGGAAAAMCFTIPWEALNECYLGGAMRYFVRVSARGSQLIPFRGEWNIARDASALVSWVGVLAGGVALISKKEPPNRAALLLLWFWAVAFLAHAYKGSASPFCGTAPVAVLLLAALVPQWTRSIRWAAGALLLAHGALLLFFRPFVAPAAATWIETERGKYLCPDPAEARHLNAVLAEIRRLVPPEGKIYIHDQAKICSPVLLYFLAGRGAGTRYHEISEGIAGEPAVHDRIVRDLESNRVSLVLEVLDERAEGKPGCASDAWIRRNFKRLSRHGRLVIWGKT